MSEQKPVREFSLEGGPVEVYEVTHGERLLLLAIKPGHEIRAVHRDAYDESEGQRARWYNATQKLLDVKEELISDNKKLSADLDLAIEALKIYDKADEKFNKSRIARDALAKLQERKT